MDIHDRPGAFHFMLLTPGNKKLSPKICRAAIKLPSEPTQIVNSRLPVVVLAPMTKLKVDNTYSCPNEFRGEANLPIECIVKEAKRGCALCILECNKSIARGPKKMEGHVEGPCGACKIHVAISSTEYFCEAVDVLNPHAHSTVFDRDDPSSAYFLDFYTTVDLEGDTCTFYGQEIFAPRFRRPVLQDTRSPHTSRIAQVWLEECLNRHPSCGTRQSQKLPSRVLDISSLPTVRLVESEGKYGWYACLSHCWGSKEGPTFLQATKENRLSLMRNIPWLILPRTFRDAMEFARRLGLRYIWIDSLCIIQDDPKDWEQESAVMAEIYINCLVTIAASTSSNPNGGLFTKPGDESESVRIATVQTADGQSAPILARWRSDHDPSNASRYPLAKRGWVLQETLLSPRTIYFIGSEILCECRAGHTCECGRGMEEGDLRKRDFWQTPIADTGPDHDNLKWHNIIREYSSMQLTYGSDTLPALSGLARQWCNSGFGQYLAGLWRQSLRQDLAWEVSGTKGLRARPWRAPTWSWASLDSTDIMYKCSGLSIPKRLSAEVVEAYCEPTGINPTGAIKAGTLVVRGKAIDAKAYCYFSIPSLESNDASPESDDASSEWETISSDVEQDSESAYSIEYLPCHMLATGPATYQWYPDILYWDPSKRQDFIASDFTVKVLLLANADPGCLNEIEELWVCLVLRPNPEDYNTYERIGLFRMEASDPSPEAEKLIHPKRADARELRSKRIGWWQNQTHNHGEDKLDMVRQLSIRRELNRRFFQLLLDAPFTDYTIV